MRRSLIAAVVVVAACTAGSATETTPLPAQPAPTAPTTVPPATARSKAEFVPVVIFLDPIERLAAAGAAIRVTWTGDTHVFTGIQQTVGAFEAGERVALEIRYESTEGSPVGPAWNQTFVAGSDGLVAIRQPWRRSSPEPSFVTMAWQAGGNRDEYLEQLDRAPGLSVTSPRWWALDADGQLVGTPDPSFVAAAHERGLSVWPYVANGFESTRTHRALADPIRRQALAAELAESARAAGVDGINVDFEAFSVVDRAAFTAFVAELAEAVAPWDGVVSVDVTARTDPASTYRPALRYDRRGLAEAADYLVVMAYDQHNRYQPGGPVAADWWVEEAVAWLMRYADPDQIILGVPFYGRIWDPDELESPTAVGIGTVARLAEEGERESDPEHGVDRVVLEDGRFLWAEVPEGLRHRTDLAQRLGLAGVAGWRLGLDSSEVWEVLG